jgi:hypothetical protein
MGEDLRPPGASQHTCGSSSPQKIRETLGEDVVDPFEPHVDTAAQNRTRSHLCTPGRRGAMRRGKERAYKAPCM